MSSAYLPIIFATLSPLIFGLMNTIDKYVVSKKVRNPLSFTIVAGIVNLIIGIALALFLNWEGISLKMIIYPAIVGAVFGSQFFLYYYILGKEDVSKMVGIIYLYPILVALLSFLFLGEKLSMIGYLGMMLIPIGAVMLSVKSWKIKLKVSLWIMGLLIIAIALYEFLIKVATNNLPEANGLAISQIFLGLIILPGLLNRKIRKDFIFETRNFKWSFLIEFLTFLGIGTTYFAMAGLPATIVSSIAATQPLAVLFIEFLFFKFGFRISKDKQFSKRIIPICLIVIGVILIYLPELL